MAILTIIQEDAPSVEVVVTPPSGVTVQPVIPVIDITAPGPQGPPGPQGSSTVSCLAGEAVGGHRVVAVHDDGLAYYVSPDDPEADYALGLTNNAAAQGQNLLISWSGEVTEPAWSWSVGPVWLGAGGTLTQTIPTTGAIVRVGIAVAPTVLLVAPRLVARL